MEARGADNNSAFVIGPFNLTFLIAALCLYLITWRFSYTHRKPADIWILQYQQKPQGAKVEDFWRTTKKFVG